MFCADHTYTTVALPYNSTAQTIVNTAEERVLLGDDCVLCEVKSSGGLFTFFLSVPSDWSTEEIRGTIFRRRLWETRWPSG